MKKFNTILGLFSVVLTMMLIPLSAEAQKITVPPGTDQSVVNLGQIYIETGNVVKTSDNLDKLPEVAEAIAIKYAENIDVNVPINDSDRRYISKCFMYSVNQILRLTIKLEGVDPDTPELAPYIDQALDDTSKQLTKKLAGAKTVGDAVEVTEDLFN